MPRHEKCIEGHVTKNARIVTWDEFPGIIGLESYGVGIVLVIESNNNHAIVSTGSYSKTTSKHVTQFLAMLGLRYRSAEVNALYNADEALFVSPEKFVPLTERETNILRDIRCYKIGWTYEALQVFYRLYQFL